ncbi:Gfo/Idh/MocA family protein [Priestia taiwanensis]|uniref:Oxidoreductase n=1 Tax=Priestia taiwanensis TaxID=1347902 RepID=A0A917ALF9_9BACI|nr:Gfo/Idh/MocA family oxidoreductase [Priestia taiwanensis]MBM7362230.1 putative dehydrogenase [Priestia taiwanensis]GGE60490.1 oxidoreductase [Priestia taiwanensis]
MRVGIIGGGFGLKIQAPIIETHPFMKVVAVSTVKRHQLPKELLEATNDFIHYENWREMLDQEELDIIFVSSMPMHHYEMAKYTIEKGISIVCEKPFTVTSKESLELCELAERNDVKALLDFEWRYLPIRQKAKEAILQGDIGDVKHFEYHVSYAEYQKLIKGKRGWIDEKEQAGGMLGALGSHMIDSLRWFTESEVHMVNGFIHTHVPEAGEEVRDADDAFFIHGKMKSGSTFSIQFLSGIHHGFGSQLRIFGNEGTITVTNDKHLHVAKGKEELTEMRIPSTDIPSYLSENAKRYYPAFYPFLEKVYTYITMNMLDRDLPTFVDGHANQIILDKVRGLQNGCESIDDE